MTTRKPATPHVWDSHKHDAELHAKIRELEAELAKEMMNFDAVRKAIIAQAHILKESQARVAELNEEFRLYRNTKGTTGPPIEPREREEG